MKRGYIITSNRSVSLKNVAQEIGSVLSENSIGVQYMYYPVLDPVLYNSIDYAIIVMSFDPVWFTPFAYLYRRLKTMGKKVFFYTVVEGRPRIPPGKEWVLRDIEVIAASRYVAKKLSEAGVTVQEIIYHGINIDKVQILAEMGVDELANAGLVPERFRLTYIAGGYNRKGHALFDKVIEIVEGMDPDIEFLVVTDDEGVKQYRQHKNLLLYNYFGKLRQEQIYGLYRLTTAYIQPSLAEGFGLPVLEAMSLGNLVIHPDYEPLSEITCRECSIRVPVRGLSYETEFGGIEYELHLYNPKEMAEAIIKAKELLAKNEQEIREMAIKRAKLFDSRKTYKRFVELIGN